MQMGRTMKHFDYSFIKREYFPTSITNYIAIIERNRGKIFISEESYPELFSELEKIARVDSVKGSNAIEGIVTTDERIKSIVSGKSTPSNHTEKEIAGYRDALNLIHEHYENISIDEDTIKEIHALMMGPSMTEDAGEYKKDDNIISEEHTDGSRSVTFAPPPATETAELMEQLIIAFKEAQQDSNINNLILIPCFIVDYLCIHPFLDGNGRISRLLTLLLFYKNGYTAGRYISFEKKINNSRQAYYAALRKCSDMWYDETPDYIPFIEFTLKMLSECYEDVGMRYEIQSTSKLTKSERIRQYLLNSIVPLSKRDLCEVLPDISQTTIELELAKMQKDGLLQKLGRGRSTRYLKK